MFDGRPVEHRYIHWVLIVLSFYDWLLNWCFISIVLITRPTVRPTHPILWYNSNSIIWAEITHLLNHKYWM